jgi:hypothetical protein
MRSALPSALQKRRSHALHKTEHLIDAQVSYVYDARPSDRGVDVHTVLQVFAIQVSTRQDPSAEKR